ncbi:hypothetical protein LT679_00505 [Mucilaginibacter roseus]|uniref:DUF4468 domain-containing protein n=1 Tax=Mucilaginibacter roseus TaxID=1528868 RepID=A0ABS8U0I9_9SPHI|nr:hypothetical protein [Mucilaginibacter roseus]MCD8739066.1 hypothetical protein [Mucilaginibacter roseus]
MNHKILLATLISACLCVSASSPAAAQAKAYKQTKFTRNADTCFMRTLNFLEKQAYFIEAVDKASGYIKAKTYAKNSKVFSTKVGERTTISFLFRQAGNETLLSLNMYAETLRWGGSTQNKVISLEDKGIIDQPSVYRELIDQLAVEMH